jgi:hypothetical protein
MKHPPITVSEHHLIVYKVHLHLSLHFAFGGGSRAFLLMTRCSLSALKSLSHSRKILTLVTRRLLCWPVVRRSLRPRSRTPAVFRGEADNAERASPRVSLVIIYPMAGRAGQELRTRKQRCDHATNIDGNTINIATGLAMGVVAHGMSVLSGGPLSHYENLIYTYHGGTDHSLQPTFGSDFPTLRLYNSTDVVFIQTVPFPAAGTIIPPPVR